jgi:hypothetical protein
MVTVVQEFMLSVMMARARADPRFSFHNTKHIQQLVKEHCLELSCETKFTVVKTLQRRLLKLLVHRTAK